MISNPQMNVGYSPSHYGLTIELVWHSHAPEEVSLLDFIALDKVKTVTNFNFEIKHIVLSVEDGLLYSLSTPDSKYKDDFFASLAHRVEKAVLREGGTPADAAYMQGFFVERFSSFLQGDQKVMYSTMGKYSHTLTRERQQLETESQTLPGMAAMVSCPVCFTHTTLRRTIICLNDNHRWTREQIADWLDEEHDKGNIDIEF